MPHKILVCDDDDGILNVIGIILQENGFETELLKNGKGILKVVRTIQPDLIFLDIWMPGIDGREVVRLLKKDPELSRIPIIVISAMTNTEDIAKSVGADGFLAKPFEIDALLALAQKFIKT